MTPFYNYSLFIVAVAIKVQWNIFARVEHIYVYFFQSIENSAQIYGIYTMMKGVALLRITNRFYWYLHLASLGCGRYNNCDISCLLLNNLKQFELLNLFQIVINYLREDMRYSKSIYYFHDNYVLAKRRNFKNYNDVLMYIHFTINTAEHLGLVLLIIFISFCIFGLNFYWRPVFLAAFTCFDCRLSIERIDTRMPSMFHAMKGWQKNISEESSLEVIFSAALFDEMLYHFQIVLQSLKYDHKSNYQLILAALGD